MSLNDKEVNDSCIKYIDDIADIQVESIHFTYGNSISDLDYDINSLTVRVELEDKQIYLIIDVLNHADTYNSLIPNFDFNIKKKDDRAKVNSYELLALANAISIWSKTFIYSEQLYASEQYIS